MSQPRGPARRQPASRPAPRRPDPSVYRRRRTTVLVALLAVAGLVASYFLLPGGGGSRTATPPSTSTAASTAAVPVHGVGVQTVTWTNPVGVAVNPAPGGTAKPRTLVTEIWYPSIGGSATAPTAGTAPDVRDGPYPVIVFAHGFNTLPSDYTPMLSSWVRAGFVVVAPLFPDENANEISSLGKVTVTEEEIAESDLVNEPYDLGYVITQVEAAAGGSSSTGAAWLKGLVEPAKLALSGQSDGAQAVAALAYASTYASTYSALPVHPFAVEILSGAELPAAAAGTYAPLSGGPPVLAVQSATDSCNLPQDAATLFSAIGGGWFLKLANAPHFPPYAGVGAAGKAVEDTTIAFYRYALAGAGTSTAALERAGNVTGVSTLYPPTSPPVLAPLPVPTTAARGAACAIPS